MHGLAQREGAITSHTRYQQETYKDERKNLQSPLISYGDADLYICLEPIEALRRGIFASAKTSFVINSRTIPGVMITADFENYPSLENIEATLNQLTSEVYFLNATDISIKNFDSNQFVNIIMLGFAIQTGKLPFINPEHYKEVINEWLRDPNLNIKALHLGLEKGNEIIQAKKGNNNNRLGSFNNSH
ncbi:MAG: 2-oxoacid:acceptor oxidoreductase family protein [Candidatus Thorarchaeota archaeon]